MDTNKKSESDRSVTLLVIMTKYGFKYHKLWCIKHCWCVYEQNGIVNSVRVDK